MLGPLQEEQFGFLEEGELVLWHVTQSLSWSSCLPNRLSQERTDRRKETCLWRHPTLVLAESPRIVCVPHDRRSLILSGLLLRRPAGAVRRSCKWYEISLTFPFGSNFLLITTCSGTQRCSSASDPSNVPGGPVLSIGKGALFLHRLTASSSLHSSPLQPIVVLSSIVRCSVARRSCSEFPGLTRRP
jgi:hypothetical protein